MKKDKKAEDGGSDLIRATMMINEDLHLKFKIQAAKDGKSMSKIFAQLVEAYLKAAERDGRS